MSVTLMFLFVLLSEAPIPAPQAADQKIEGVEIRGNRRIPAETIRYYIQTKPGDVLRMEVIRHDVKELYAQRFFDDIRVDAEAGKDGGIRVIFVVKERPLVRGIDFTGLNSITRSDILEKLKEKKISISQESPYDPGKVRQVETIIKSMLAEKGHQQATVEATTEEVPPNAVKLDFKVSEGPAIRVDKIRIEGNTVFSERQLKKAMKLVKETNPLTVITGKDTYYDLKLADDLTRIRIFYADHGYVRANILDPIVETKPKTVARTLPLIKPPFPFGIPLPFWKKSVNRYDITLKIEENDQYRVGE